MSPKRRTTLALLCTLPLVGCANLPGCFSALEMNDFRLLEIRLVELEKVPTRVGRSSSRTRSLVISP